MASRRLTLVAVGLIAAAAIWLVWPRPDLEIRVARGGLATVSDGLGRATPLRDTIVVRGAGARRTVRVVNQDTMQHVLAIFTVDAGARMDFAVPPGTFGGFCSAHPGSKHLTVVVR